MKKLLLFMIFVAGMASISVAQNKRSVVKDEKTSKPTSSVPQKVHNTFSKHKQHNGRKTKHTRVVEKK